MTAPRAGHAMVPIPLPSGLSTPLHVLVMGGKSTNGVVTASVERCWQSAGITGIAFECLGTVSTQMGMEEIPDMTVPRVNHIAFYDNAATARKVHVIGGDGLDSAECYNPPANAWGPITASKMSSPRSFFTVTQRWPNSAKYLVVGGVSGPDGAGNSLKSTEMYDASTETFTHGVDLVMPRSHHTAILLGDKRVLVAGGADGNIGTAETLLCTGNDDCPNNQYCSITGICLPFKTQGQMCDAKTDCWEGAECKMCDTGFCADGVCCDAACLGTCEACDNAMLGHTVGTCAPVTKPRHGSCGETTDPCMGRCDGDFAECLYPAGKPCKKECVASMDSPQSTLTTYACDEEGACIVPTLDVSCGNYQCLGTDACNQACNEADMATQCITGYRCNPDTSTCVEAQKECGTAAATEGPDIDVVQTVVSPPAEPRIISRCNGFKCDTLTAQCLTACTTAYDCTNGYTCDSNYACIRENFPTDAEIDETISCSVAPANESSRWGWLAALALAGAVATRRNRARS